MNAVRFFEMRAFCFYVNTLCYFFSYSAQALHSIALILVVQILSRIFFVLIRSIGYGMCFSFTVSPHN